MIVATVGVKDSSVGADEVVEIDRLLLMTIAAQKAPSTGVILMLQQSAVRGRFGARERRRWAVPS